MSPFKSLTLFFSDLFSYRKTIWLMALKDRSNRGLTSYLGFLWSFIQPIFTILVLWFVFIFGFRAGNEMDGYPFILWLSVGLIPWSFFADALNNGTESITSYDYLVKKVVFKVEALPIIRILSSFFVHAILMALLIIMALIYGTVSLYAIQTIYYLMCLIVLVFGITLITASINVFTRDTAQLLSIFVQLGFWITPIFWNLSGIPQKYQYLIKLNPMSYVVQGYRDSLIYKVSFWERPLWTLTFWITTMIILWLGILVFSKTRPYFANVL